MKKTLLLASVACACALAANASYDSWFTGMNGATGTNAMGQVNGTWVFNVTNGEATVESNKLVFDLDDGETIVFNADQAAAPDTNTITSVAVTGVFTPVKVSDLPTDAEMNTRGAQVGFVVGSANDTYNYYAWVGVTAAQADGKSWFSVGDPILAANIENETALVVEFDYSHRTHATKNYVTFKVGGSVVGSAAYEMTSTAGEAASSVAGMTCYGSGTLAAANGSVEIGVATVDGIKYASLGDAVTATGSATDPTITIVRTTTDSATLPDGVKIYDPDGKASGASISVVDGGTATIKATAAESNNGASGPCSVPLSVALGSNSKIQIELDSVADNKEVTNLVVGANSVTFDLQTKTEILAAANPGGNKALSANVAKLRQFIAADTALNTADVAADVSTASIQTALQVNGGNGIPKWESYVLGIAPNASIKPVTAPAGDTSTTAITLAIPAINSANYSGDYTVKYKVGDGEEQSDPSAIEVPLATGTKTIKVVLKP